MTNKILLSLVIPVFNKADEAARLLQSVNESHFRSFSHIETIVVDDGSSEPIEKKLAKLAKKLPFTVKVVRLKRNRGPAYARNTGVEKAEGDYILFLDADVILKKKSLKHAYNFFSQKEGRAMTGIWDSSQKNTDFFPRFKALRDASYWFVEREKEARYYLFSTRIAGIEKKLFTKLGGFNTKYPKPTVEDIEFTYRIEQQTKIHFQPDIVVEHEFEDFITVARKYFARSRDWIKLYIKRLRFDPVATSKTEAKKSMLVGFALILFICYGITRQPLFFALSAFVWVIYVWLERPFLKFLIDKEGVVFAIKSLPIAIVLYLIINAGATIGLLDYYFKKFSGLTSLPSE